MGTAGVKVVSMAAGGVLGIFSSRIIIQHFGVDAYAQYGLLAGVSNLLPFADLGIGAVVLNVIASSEDPTHSRRVRAALMTAVRTLCVSGVLIAGISVMIGVAGWWPMLLGRGLMANGSLTATLCMCVLGLSLPFGIGVRILIGLRRNMLQAVLQSLQSPIFVLSVVVVALLGADAGGVFLPVLSYLAASVSSLVLLVVGARKISPQLRLAVRGALRVRTVPGVRVVGTAAPVLVQSIAMPIAMQSDRLLISHRASSDALAQYTFASQVFGMILGAVVAGGVALWPFFARARARGEILNPDSLMVAFFSGALICSTLLAVAMPVLEHVVANGEVHLSPMLLLSFVLFIAVQALNYPPGMYLTDERGLQFQVVPIICMAVANVVLSWFLIPPLGAAGPVLGSAIAVVIFQVLPYTWWVRRDMRSRRMTAAEQAAHVVGAPG